MTQEKSTPSNIPRARNNLAILIHALKENIAPQLRDPSDLQKIIDALENIVLPMLHRAKPKRRAPAQRRTPLTTVARATITAFVAKNPNMLLDDVGRRFGTSSARISEIINGLKSSKPEHLPVTREEME